MTHSGKTGFKVTVRFTRFLGTFAGGSLDFNDCLPFIK